MKLSKTSMLYRSAELYDVVGYSHPRDLCTFVRRYLFRITVYSLFAFTVGFITTCMLFFIIGYLTTGYWDDESAMFAIGSGFTAIVPCVAFFLWVVWIITKYRENKVEKEPGIIAAYLKAKKEKYCPMLEFTE